jgi:hypothetical protein
MHRVIPSKLACKQVNIQPTFHKKKYLQYCFEKIRNSESKQNIFKNKADEPN